MPLSFGVASKFSATRDVEDIDISIRYGRYLVFNCDYTDGEDLDLRVSITDPTGIIGTLGIGRNNQVPITGEPYLVWGGDNVGTGKESFYFDKQQFLSSFPPNLITSIEIDLRAYWYKTVGLNPVLVTMKSYEGGTMIHDGYEFKNVGYINQYNSSKSFEKVITAKESSFDSDGERIARIVINFVNDSIDYLQ